MAEQMSAAHLASQGHFEPQRAFNWLLHIDDLNVNIGKMQANKTIKLAVESISYPRFSTQVISQRYLNQARKVAGGATVDAMNVSIRDYVDQPTFQVLNGWMELVHDPVTGKIGTTDKYKKPGSLILMGPDGEERGRIHLHGVWPSQFSGTELSYGTDNADVKIAMTLQVDIFDMREMQDAVIF
jgi:hypothetical protein